MRYALWHRTTYAYDELVNDSLGIGHLLPRSLPWQQVHSATVSVSPAPSDTSEDLDCFGNVVTYFQVTEPHTVLVVEAASHVEVEDTAYDPTALVRPWDQCLPLAQPTLGFAWQTSDFALPSSLVAQPGGAREYAALSLVPGRPIGEAVTHLVHRIHTEFDYDPKATTVTSTVVDILAKRAGVCQDFAHLTLACLRSHGLAARYVSGYLATEPAPGQERVVGADASHAWVAVWLPQAHGPGQWLAVDPTNDQWVGDRYVTVAWGRDYSDVPPLKGVIFTEARTSTLDVAVDIARVG